MSLYPIVAEKRKTMDGMPVLQKEFGEAMTRFVLFCSNAATTSTIVYTWPRGCLRQSSKLRYILRYDVAMYA